MLEFLTLLGQCHVPLGVGPIDTASTMKSTGVEATTRTTITEKGKL